MNCKKAFFKTSRTYANGAGLVWSTIRTISNGYLIRILVVALELWLFVLVTDLYLVPWLQTLEVPYIIPLIVAIVVTMVLTVTFLTFFVDSFIHNCQKDDDEQIERDLSAPYRND